MIFDNLTRHQVYLSRYGGGLYREFIPELNKLRDRVIQSLSAVNLSIMDKRALEAKLLEIEGLITASVDKAINIDTFKDLAVYEYEFITRMLTANTVAGTAIISTGINLQAAAIMIGKSKLVLDGKKPMTIDQTIKQFSKRYYKDIKSEIQIGLAQGLVTDEIVANIQALSKGRTKAQAEALVRTLANHVGNVARENVFKNNSKLFKGERFVSVLDARTSSICAAASSYNGDGIYPLGKAPRPALHYNCRSFVVKLLKDEYSLDDGTETQTSKFGLVPQGWTYDDFLRRQGKDFQIDVLGKERAKIYRESKLPIDRFIDKSGKYYTLDELKNKDMLK